MALIQVNYMSRSLFRLVPVNVILPVDRFDADNDCYINGKEQKYKTLYLLHGLLGNYTDWVSQTRIQKWAEEKNLAVVMPSGDNSFYFNARTPWNDYSTFIGEELVEVTRRMFPLSDKREDTFIAGLSMGGFGALRYSAIYSETFSHVAALSSAVHIFEDTSEEANNGLFDNKAEAAASDINPWVAVENMLAEKRPVPKYYMACGTQDDLMPANIVFRDMLIEKGMDVTWDEEDYGHDWDFWDSQIKKVLDWLPL
ncbi:MAG: acetylesterase [Lachnospiraceae bacterium]|nr:acetylesterase [Lachnospiraceae bacterium]